VPLAHRHVSAVSSYHNGHVRVSACFQTRGFDDALPVLHQLPWNKDQTRSPTNVRKLENLCLRTASFKLFEVALLLTRVQKLRSKSQPLSRRGRSPIADCWTSTPDSATAGQFSHIPKLECLLEAGVGSSRYKLGPKCAIGLRLGFELLSARASPFNTALRCNGKTQWRI